jgi:hypothetical protein
MGVSTETFPDENIIVITIVPPVVMPDDPANATKETMKFQKEQGTTICRITDFTQVKLSFADVIEGLATDEAFRSPHVRSVVVGTDPMTKVGVKGYLEAPYGGLDVLLTPTREEAMRQARRLLSETDNTE